MSHAYTPADAASPGPHADGVAALAAGEPARAAALLTQAVQERPDEAARRSDLGDALSATGDLPGAHAAYSAAVALAPDNALHHFNLGVAAQRLGRTVEAANHYADALQREPMLAPAYFNLATLFQDSGHLDEAAQHYSNALKADPTYAQAAGNLGLVLRRLGRVDDALTALTATAGLLPETPQAWANVGLLQNESGHYADALASFDHLASLLPGAAIAELGRAEALRGLGRWDEAVASLTAVLAAPDHPARAEIEAALLAALLKRAHQSAALETLLATWHAALGDTPAYTHTLAALGRAPLPLRMDPAYLTQLAEVSAQRDMETITANKSLDDELAPLLAKHLGPAQGALRILDGVAGSGALAALLRPYASSLAGVDAGRTHLETAIRRNLYTALAQGDVLTFLESNTGALDVVVLPGQFDFHGDLAYPLGYVADALAPGGLLLATLEVAEPWDPAVVLRDDGRFIHRRDAVESSLAAAGLSVVEVQNLPPRPAPYTLAAANRIAVVARKG